MQLHLLIYIRWRVCRLLRPVGPGTTLTLAHTNNQYIAERALASNGSYAKLLHQLRIASSRCPLTICRKQLEVSSYRTVQMARIVFWLADCSSYRPVWPCTCQL